MFRFVGKLPLGFFKFFGIALKTIAVIWSFLWLIVYVHLARDMTSWRSILSLLALFVGTPVLVFWAGRGLTQWSVRAKIYLSAILKDGVRRMADLEPLVGRPCREVYKDLDRLVRYGFLEGARLDPVGGDIALPGERFTASENPGR